ncbi:hypothetical protein NYE70_15250 [Paenibacillus sp. FSL R5-0407]|uniref:hypothetical protein n=1 Tax=Paenibacillus TaxID=44249 RepID=UPI0025B7074C|nr:hypothetical protein [Paenibacillus vini]MDN4066427.1 hypothetical protein [Paenibacillus vini]
MVSYMGWIVLSYGLAAVLVHFLHGVLLREKPKDGKRLHYILVTHNHGNQMEWYLRALSWYARLRGESVKVTVLDEASQDDTVAIIQRLRDQAGIELTTIGLMTADADEISRQATAWTEEEIQVYVDLRVPQEAAKIPYVHV